MSVIAELRKKRRENSPTTAVLRQREASIERAANCLRHRTDAPSVLPPIETRNLLYHVAPFTDSMWRKSIADLLPRLGQFNGSKVIVIATGRKLDPPNEVEEMFRGHDVQFKTFLNDRVLWETIGFHWSWQQVETDDWTHATFRGHAKGVTRPVDSPTHRWSEIAHEVCLDYSSVVDEGLAKHHVVGPFKKIGKGFRGSKSRWHYSGSFYWVRNAELFRRNWGVINWSNWGVESWPSLLFTVEEAGCLFHEGTVPGLNLYSQAYIDNVVTPAYEAWKQEV